ncbi:hypothetical protein GGF43_002695, partial [Coemansia sp. RSA 2618]
NADTLARATRRPPAQILPVPAVLQRPTKHATPSTAKAAAPRAVEKPASSQPESDTSSDAMDISDDFSVLSVTPQPAPELAPCPTNDAVMVPANPDTTNQEIAVPAEAPATANIQEIAVPAGAPLAANQDAPAPPSPKLAALAEPTESTMQDLTILATTATAEFEMHSQPAAPMPADSEPATPVATTGSELTALAEATEPATDSSNTPVIASAPAPAAESTVHANLVFAADAMSAARAPEGPRAPTFTAPEGIAAPELATASFTDLQTTALARPAPSLSLSKHSQPKTPNAAATIKASLPAPSASEFAFPARQAQPAEEQEDESWEIHPDEAALHRPADGEASTSTSANASTSAKQKKPLATKVRRGRGAIRSSVDSAEKRIWNQTHAPTARGEAPDTFVPFHLKRRGITRMPFKDTPAASARPFRPDLSSDPSLASLDSSSLFLQYDPESDNSDIRHELTFAMDSSEDDAWHNAHEATYNDEPEWLGPPSSPRPDAPPVVIAAASLERSRVRQTPMPTPPDRAVTRSQRTAAQPMDTTEGPAANGRSADASPAVNVSSDEDAMEVDGGMSSTAPRL